LIRDNREPSGDLRLYFTHIDVMNATKSLHKHAQHSTAAIIIIANDNSSDNNNNHHHHNNNNNNNDNDNNKKILKIKIKR
jgi:hypothetical protein